MIGGRSTNGIVPFAREREPLAQPVRVTDVAGANADPGGLVGICRSNAAPGTPDAQVGRSGGVVDAIDGNMIRQDKVCSLGDQQAIEVDSLLRKAANLTR